MGIKARLWGIRAGMWGIMSGLSNTAASPAPEPIFASFGGPGHDSPQNGLGTLSFFFRASRRAIQELPLFVYKVAPALTSQGARAGSGLTYWNKTAQTATRGPNTLDPISTLDTQLSERW